MRRALRHPAAGASAAGLQVRCDASCALLGAAILPVLMLLAGIVFPQHGRRRWQSLSQVRLNQTLDLGCGHQERPVELDRGHAARITQPPCGRD